MASDLERLPAQVHLAVVFMLDELAALKDPSVSPERIARTAQMLDTYLRLLLKTTDKVLRGKSAEGEVIGKE